MKFCYADFDPQTDVDDVFTYYRSNIDSLIEERPDIRFLHMTVPLKVHRPTLKSRVKKLLGRSIWSEGSNIRRAEFNEHLRRTYDVSQIIDVAELESTDLTGAMTGFRKDGRQFPSLNPAFSSDGGHLNELGSRIVAAGMIRILADNLRRAEGAS
jgi:hypothetical protein